VVWPTWAAAFVSFCTWGVAHLGRSFCFLLHVWCGPPGPQHFFPFARVVWPTWAAAFVFSRACGVAHLGRSIFFLSHVWCGNLLFFGICFDHCTHVPRRYPLCTLTATPFQNKSPSYLPCTIVLASIITSMNHCASMYTGFHTVSDYFKTGFPCMFCVNDCCPDCSVSAAATLWRSGFTSQRPTRHTSSSLGCCHRFCKRCGISLLRWSRSTAAPGKARVHQTLRERVLSCVHG
jgi:hypothetical protein